MLITPTWCAKLEIKTAAESDELAHFTGTASTSDVDLVDDVIEAGAFGHIDPKRVAMLRDHIATNLIGGWSSFEQDGKSLKVEGIITLSTALGRETHTLMKQGFLNGLSVGYRPKKGGMSYDDATGIRRIKKATLIECSIVSVPCNTHARVRSVKSLISSPEMLHEFLADAGFDDEQIETIIHRGFDALHTTVRSGITIHEVDGFTDKTTADADAALKAVQALLQDVRQPHV